MANEQRLIDANEAYEIARSSGLHDDFGRCMADLTSLKELLEDCTTVDAVEVVHAEWACVNESDNVWMCTGKNGCGNEILFLEGTPTENGWHYCPNCGAKMDGGNEDR